jgi:hypothetical protein
MGVGVTLEVGVTVWVCVSLGFGVTDGAAEGKISCVAAGTQAFKRRISRNRKQFFIVRLVGL